jgi:hypothetical protein
LGKGLGENDICLMEFCILSVSPTTKDCCDVQGLVWAVRSAGNCIERWFAASQSLVSKFNVGSRKQNA